MTWPDLYLFCFAVGALWSFATLLLGGMHLGHAHGAHAHIAAHGHGVHAGSHGHAAHAHTMGQEASWLASLINPSAAAIFLAWFGGAGYLLTRHSPLFWWIDLAIAAALGLGGASALAAFLRFLQSREQPLDPLDYEMTGVLGRVSSTIRSEGVGELIYLRDGARQCTPACSEDGIDIARGEEVIVTRYEKGIAFVRTWDAMTNGIPGNAVTKERKEAS